MDTILEHGHQVVVVRDPDDIDSPFAYTVGRAVKDRPELLLTGPVPPTILNDLAKYDDGQPLSGGDVLLADTILTGYPVRIEVADPMAASMFQAIRLFGDDVTALQMLWPDPQGLFPGEDGYAYAADVQPFYPPQ